MDTGDIGSNILRSLLLHLIELAIYVLCTCTQPFCAVAEDIFILAVGQKPRVNLSGCTLEILFLLYLLTYLLMF